VSALVVVVWGVFAAGVSLALGTPLPVAIWAVGTSIGLGAPLVWRALLRRVKAVDPDA
jgi:hypothetical protein